MDLDVVQRLKKVEGQVRGISSMIGREEDSSKVLQQITAATSALKVIHCIVATENLRVRTKGSRKNADVDLLIKNLTKVL